MKRVLFLLLVSVFMLPAFHSEAQVQGTQTPTHYQELTKQQQRQVKRDLRKKAREVANQQAFNAAVDALKDRNWVLMASTLYEKQYVSRPLVPLWFQWPLRPVLVAPGLRITR